LQLVKPEPYSLAEMGGEVIAGCDLAKKKLDILRLMVSFERSAELLGAMHPTPVRVH
jgi:hypothetical protein